MFERFGYVVGETKDLVTRKIPNFFVRGYKGVAKSDTWSFDHYLSRVIAAGLREMAKKPHGVPQFIMDEYAIEAAASDLPCDVDRACEYWQAWLIDKAEWFEWYVNEDVGMRPDMTNEERLQALDFWDKKYDKFKKEILPDFFEHFDSLWD
jgi:hypothetical protein